jgi:hypothetical protein
MFSCSVRWYLQQLCSINVMLELFVWISLIHRLYAERFNFTARFFPFPVTCACYNERNINCVKHEGYALSVCIINTSGTRQKTCVLGCQFSFCRHIYVVTVKKTLIYIVMHEGKCIHILVCHYDLHLNVCSSACTSNSVCKLQGGSQVCALYCFLNV